MRDAGVSNKKMKRRLKRIREKVASGKEEVHRPEGGESLSVWEEEREDGSGLGGNKEDAALNQDRVLLRDVLEKGAGMKCTHRVRSVAFRFLLTDLSNLFLYNIFAAGLVR